jgi:hypothetical protein
VVNSNTGVKAVSGANNPQKKWLAFANHLSFLYPGRESNPYSRNGHRIFLPLWLSPPATGAAFVVWTFSSSDAADVACQVSTPSLRKELGSGLPRFHRGFPEFKRFYIPHY